MQFGFSASVLPIRVVAILQAPFHVAAHGLNVSAIILGDADFGPSRRNRELTDARF
jgi:hypothetical protein